MRERSCRHIASILLLVFALFVGANHLCMHSHLIEGVGYVTHSHPFMPGAEHSHSSQSVNTIGSINAGLFDNASAQLAGIVCYADLIESIFTPVDTHFVSVGVYFSADRAPPVM